MLIKDGEDIGQKDHGLGRAGLHQGVIDIARAHNLDWQLFCGHRDTAEACAWLGKKQEATDAYRRCIAAAHKLGMDTGPYELEIARLQAE